MRVSYLFIVFLVLATVVATFAEEKTQTESEKADLEISEEVGEGKGKGWGKGGGKHYGKSWGKGKGWGAPVNFRRGKRGGKHGGAMQVHMAPGKGFGAAPKGIPAAGNLFVAPVGGEAITAVATNSTSAQYDAIDINKLSGMTDSQVYELVQTVCGNCQGGTHGVCVHTKNCVCYPKQNGDCPAYTTRCGGGVCNCAPGSGGPCLSNNGVCYMSINGNCPAGTVLINEPGWY